MSGQLTVEACIALRDLGYPEDSHWVYYRLSDSKEWRETCYFDEFLPLTGKEYVACPEPLDALDWIESEHGWGWNRVTRRTTHQSPIWYAWRESTTLEESPDYAEGDSVNTLILAIAKHHAAKEGKRE